MISVVGSVLLHDRGAQVGFFDGVDGQLGESAAARAARQGAGVDDQGAEDLLGDGVQPGGQDQHVGVGLELPVLRVAQVVL